MDTRQRSRLVVTAVITVAIALLIALWDWDWLKPMVERRASAALGRPVRVAHMHVHLAREPTLVADGVEIDNPAPFPEGSRFGSIERLSVQVAPHALLHHALVLPLIEIKRPQANLVAPALGRPNWTLPGAEGAPATNPWRVDVGRLLIEGGTGVLRDPLHFGGADLALKLQGTILLRSIL
jgi:AsmA family protein